MVAALMDDLLFLSRIREAVRPREVKAVRRLPDLLALRPGLLIVDVDSPRLPTLEALRAVGQDPAWSGVPVLGFFSHVNPEGARAALEAGCTRVFPRSLFLDELRKSLPQEEAGEP